MASTPKQSNGNLPPNNGSGKRKKSRGSKGSYLSKWLDKTMHHINSTSEVFDTDMSPYMNCSQFSPGYDPYKYMYSTEPMSYPYSEYRYIHNDTVQRPRRRSEKAEEVSSTPADNQTNYLQPKNFTDSQDYTSLPPIVTSMDTTSDLQANDKEDCSNARRYSDPCVRGLPDVAQPANGDVDSNSDSLGSDSQVGTRLLSCLLDQITALKTTNDRLNKELHETRAELETVRHHNLYFPKGPSGMGAANPNGNGSQYSPGFVTELVREIRDAARMREDSMYARLRAMVLERTDNVLSSTESKLVERTLEEVKSSLRASEADKRRMMDRIVKLEDDIRILRLGNSYESNESRMNGNVEDAECERLRLRKELADTRRSKQIAEEHAHKLERLVTQLRSKFNGLQITNGPDSLPSEPEHDTRRRTNSTNNLTNVTNMTNTTANLTNLTNNLANSNPTVVFGPVTDL